MIDDKMGSIGSTQGVNDSSRPATRNTPAMVSRLPDCKAFWMREFSLTGAAGATDATDEAAPDAAGTADDAPRCASSALMASTPCAWPPAATLTRR